MKKLLAQILFVAMIVSLFTVATINASDLTDPHAPTRIVVQK